MVVNFYQLARTRTDFFSMEKPVKRSENFPLRMVIVVVFMQLAGVPMGSRLKLNHLMLI